jgi:hypothetical protein
MITTELMQEILDNFSSLQRQDLINTIFSIITSPDYTEITSEEIVQYEQMYKLLVMELLADYVYEYVEDEEERIDTEEYLLSLYNPTNLVNYFKKEWVNSTT